MGTVRERCGCVALSAPHAGQVDVSSVPVTSKLAPFHQGSANCSSLEVVAILGATGAFGWRFVRVVVRLGRTCTRRLYKEEKRSGGARKLSAKGLSLGATCRWPRFTELQSYTCCNSHKRTGVRLKQDHPNDNNKRGGSLPGKKTILVLFFSVWSRFCTATFSPVGAAIAEPATKANAG